MKRALGSLLGWLRDLWAPSRPLVPARAPVPGIDAPHVRRLDPPGLFDDVEVFGVTQWSWQLTCANLIVLVRDGERSVVARRHGHAQQPMCLDRLTGGPWAPLEQAWTHAGFIKEWWADEAREDDGVDLTPYLHRGLRRLEGAGDPSGLVDAIGLLEVLARHDGEGSQALERPWVQFGEAALDYVARFLGCGVDDDDDQPNSEPTRRWNSVQRWIDPSLEGGPDAALRRALCGGEGGDASSGGLRATALVERTYTHDGTSDGSFNEAALVILRVDADGWSYERRPLWTADIPGLELS